MEFVCHCQPSPYRRVQRGVAGSTAETSRQLSQCLTYPAKLSSDTCVERISHQSREGIWINAQVTSDLT